MNKQTFKLDSFIGRQFHTLAKRFCKEFVLNKPCEAIIDTEKYIFLVTTEEITISSPSI